MTFVRYLLIYAGIFILSACQPEGNSPFSVDTSEGSFTLHQEDGLSGPFRLELNGVSVLENGHVFQGSDSLVVISSVSGLDLISVFKEAGGQALMQISVINPTDSSLEISRLDLFHTPGKGLKENQLLFSPTGKTESLWQWESDDPERRLGCSLKLSGSSILLLPEERIVLPPLHFFSHLCSE